MARKKARHSQLQLPNNAPIAFPWTIILTWAALMLVFGILTFIVYSSYTFNRLTDQTELEKANYTVTMPSLRKEPLDTVSAPGVDFQPASDGMPPMLIIRPPLDADAIFVGGIILSDNPFAGAIINGSQTDVDNFQRTAKIGNDASCFSEQANDQSRGRINLKSMPGAIKKTSFYWNDKKDPVFRIDVRKALISQPGLNPFKRIQCVVKDNAEALSIERRRITIGSSADLKAFGKAVQPNAFAIAYRVGYASESAADATFHTSENGGFERRGDTHGDLEPGGVVRIDWNDEAGSQLRDFYLIVLGVFGGIVGAIFIEIVHTLVDFFVARRAAHL